MGVIVRGTRSRAHALFCKNRRRVGVGPLKQPLNEKRKDSLAAIGSLQRTTGRAHEVTHRVIYDNNSTFPPTATVLIVNVRSLTKRSR